MLSLLPGDAGEWLVHLYTAAWWPALLALMAFALGAPLTRARRRAAAFPHPSSTGPSARAAGLLAAATPPEALPRPDAPRSAGAPLVAAPLGGLSATDLLDAVPLAILFVDGDERVRYLNAAARRLCGEESEALLGRPCREALSALLGEEVANVGDAVSGPDPLTTSLSLGAGSLAGKQADLGRRATVTAVPVWEGERRAGTVIALQMAADDRGPAREHEDLLLLLSHELRSPLAYIGASAELLTDEDVEAPVRRDILVEIRRQSERLALMLESILDASRLRSGMASVTLQPMPLPPLLARAVGNARLRNAGRSIRVEADSHALPFVMGDELRIEIILRNLLENADKYTPPEREVVLRAEQVAPEEVRISVADDGPGIPPEQMGQLFDRFRRVGGTRARRRYGHGLGLFICQTLVQAQGGQIGVRSREGGGSLFWFTLRVANEELGDE